MVMAGMMFMILMWVLRTIIPLVYEVEVLDVLTSSKKVCLSRSQALNTIIEMYASKEYHASLVSHSVRCICVHTLLLNLAFDRTYTQ